MVAKVKVTGRTRTLAAFNKYGRLGPRAVAAALAEKGKQVLNLATQYAPYDIDRKGNNPVHIRDSGYVEVPSTNSDRLTVEVGFTAPHAHHVHETDKNYRIGGWKYLERAWNEIDPMPEVQGMVAGIIRRGKVPLRHESRRRQKASQRARRSGLAELRKRNR